MVAVFKKTDSPGPGYYVNPKMSRYGSDGTPSFSMSSRTKDFKPVRSFINSLGGAWMSGLGCC